MAGLLSDLRELKNNPTTKVKAEITDKITKMYNGDLFSNDEKAKAEEIIKLLVEKSEQSIRSVIAKNLKFNMDIDKGTILKLAHDVEIVSAPVLEFNPQLNNQDLIDIVKSTSNENVVSTIAKRNDIRVELSDNIVNRNFYQAINNLVSNLKAPLSDDSYYFILDHYKDEDLLAKVVERNDIPLNLITKIFDLVSNELQSTLIESYQIELANGEIKTISGSVPDKLDNNYHIMAAQAELISDITKSADANQIISLVEELASEQKLDANTVIKSLCSGNLLLFIFSLAKLSKQEYQLTYDIVMKEGAASFASLYRAAKMPRTMLQAVYNTLQVVLALFPEGKIEHNNFSNRVMTRIIELEYDQKIENMSQIITLLVKR